MKRSHFYQTANLVLILNVFNNGETMLQIENEGLPISTYEISLAV